MNYLHATTIVFFILINYLNESLGSESFIKQLNEEKPVVMVIAVARHGWRTAGEARYPGDPLKDRQEELWPEGLMQLTNRGKLEQYNLGKWLSQRYSTLLSEGYTSESVYTLSTGKDRSVMSAMCLMAGMFPPKNHQIWNPNLLWNPVPVHSYDDTAGNLLNSYSQVNCPKYWVEFERMKLTPEYRALIGSYKNLTEYIFNKTSSDLKDFKEIEWLYDYIESQTFKNITIPVWAQEIYPEPWQSAALNYFVMPTFNDQLKKLFMGPLLKEIKQQFERKRADKSGYKFYLLAGHDDNISNLLNFLGTFNWIIPPFSSVVLMELRKSSNEEFFVTVYYKNSTEEPYLMTPKACESVCPLNNFISLLAPYIPNNWDEECSINKGVSIKGVWITLLLTTTLNKIYFQN